MRRFLVFLMFLVLMCPFVAQAQEVSDDGFEEIIVEEEESLAVITVDEQLEVSRAAIFDASESVLPEDDTYHSVVYNWDFGDGNKDQGVEVVHSYIEPGEHDITLEILIDSDVYASEQKTVFVYTKRYLLITDQADEQEGIESKVAFARDLGVYVQVISSFDSASEFIVEEDLLKKLNESSSDLSQNDTILIWTRGSSGLTVLSRFAQSSTGATIFNNKDFVVITDQNLTTIRNIAQGTFRVIHPSSMVLTRPEAMWMLFEEDEVVDFVDDLETRGVEYVEITEALTLTPFNFLSYLISYMVEKGVPSNSLLLILMLPVIVTIVAFLKQVIGLTTMGVYTPSIIALSFIALDIRFGLMIFVILLMSGTLTRLFLRRYRLLYIPRTAILLTMVSLTILVLMFLGAYFDISQIVSISIFPMLIMSTMVEKFVSVQGDRGFKSALFMIGSTTFVSVICYYVAEWALLKTLIFGHPEIIFLFLVLNVILARWSGLRLLEYVRFREIFRYSEEE